MNKRFLNLNPIVSYQLASFSLVSFISYLAIIYFDFTQISYGILQTIAGICSLIFGMVASLSFLQYRSWSLLRFNQTAQLNAIDESMARIEFLPTGIILHANSNFLNLMEYSLKEIQGQHHRIFVDPKYSESMEYEKFWRDLNSKRIMTSEFKRLSKTKKEVWIQASYTPILDSKGKIVKIVKYAHDITKSKLLSIEMERSQSEITRILQDMENGILTTEMEGEYIGPFLNLKNSMNQTLSRLRSSIHLVQEKSNELVHFANNLKDIALSLQQTAIQQSSSMDNINNSLKALNSSVELNANAAKSTYSISEQITQEAKLGSASVEDTAKAMNLVVKQISVIKEISDQTNLLSLNAAIEAARAGESGQGFSVVASEVKKLSDKSNASANQVSKLATDSIKIANDALQKISAILPMIEESSQMMRNIYLSTDQQKDEIGSIVHTAIQKLDSTAQDNAMLSEELARASIDLSKSAESLKESVTFFQINSPNES